MPAPATFAGVLGFVLSLAMVLFGISLLALLSLQSDYGARTARSTGAPTRATVVLALIDFGARRQLRGRRYRCCSSAGCSAGSR